MPRVRDILAGGWDALIGRSRLLERVLVAALRQFYSSRHRWQWRWSREPPHFYEQRMGFFELGFGKAPSGPYPYHRAFLNSQVIRAGDQLLDIGCGDGFFTRRFFSVRCAHVDGLDVEPSAIATAGEQNSGPNVTYHLLDATSAPWPRERYDVVVWDGAIGHFAPAAVDEVLRKIAKAVGGEGVFVGSESLGREGSDHLRFFESLEDLRALLASHFQVVTLREERYAIGDGTFVRREAYWRCSQSARRLRDADWEWSGPTRATDSEPGSARQGPRESR